MIGFRYLFQTRNWESRSLAEFTPTTRKSRARYYSASIQERRVARIYFSRTRDENEWGKPVSIVLLYPLSSYLTGVSFGVWRL